MNLCGYETMNGIKCIAFNLFGDDSNFNVWLDKTNGMIVKIECHYHQADTEKVDTVMYYRYKIGDVVDENVMKPNLNRYSIINL